MVWKDYGSAAGFGLWLAAGMLFGAGCSVDIGDGTQQAGQTCLRDSQCSGELVCYDRTCRPRSVAEKDRGATDAGDGAAPDTPDPRDIPPVDGGDVRSRCDGFDGPRCDGADARLVCTDEGVVSRRCTGGRECRDGRCVQRCVDRDGDGYGRGCDKGEDCRDDDPEIHSGASERCGNGVDDDCDGRVDEGCDQCCPDGCGSGEFCRNCSCQSYDPSTCRYPMQPCDDRGANNGFVCREFAGSDRARCVSSCDKNGDNPTQRCRLSESQCLFGTDSTGVCAATCELDRGCGIEGFGCLPYDGSSEGVCVPVDEDNAVGSRCNPSEAVTDCETGALCAGRGRRGQCIQACRPFAEDDSTDCDRGHCLPISPQVGICRPDNGHSAGEQCGEPRTTCGSDAVMCASGRGRGRCVTLCRLDEDDGDCDSGERCREIRGEEGLGVCQ